MIKSIAALLIITFVLACNETAKQEVNETENTVESVTLPEPSESAPKDVITADGISVNVYDFENFKPFLDIKDDQIHVINFWATWCKPCVAELPAFEELGKKYPELDITLVSLDFFNNIETGVIPFIQKNELKSKVIVLHEPDGNSWIPQIDENWSGAIPATIIYKGENSKFYEQSFTFDELESAIKSVN